MVPFASIRSRVQIPRATEQNKGERIVMLPDGRQFIKHYITAANREARQTWYDVLRPYVPDKPISGPVIARVAFAYPYLASDKKSVVTAGKLVWKDTKPDLDNIEKGFWDCVTRMDFWDDDAQLVCKLVSKFRAPFCGISADLWEVDPVFASWSVDDQLAFGQSLSLTNQQ